MAEEYKGGPIFRPLYAPPIHQCIAKGDLGEMKALAKEAEQYQNSQGDFAAAFAKLKSEIARLEKK